MIVEERSGKKVQEKVIIIIKKWPGEYPCRIVTKASFLLAYLVQAQQGAGLKIPDR